MKRLWHILALLLLLAPVALADAHRTTPSPREHDHDRAREALRRGDVLPLAELLVAVESRFGGRVIEVEFERDDGRYVYEFEIATASGRLQEVTIDAATGAVLEHGEED